MFGVALLMMLCSSILLWLESASAAHVPVWMQNDAASLQSTVESSPNHEDIIMEKLLPSRPTRSRIPVAHPACRTVEQWSTLDQAVDIFGNDVRIVQKFSQDNAMVPQNFYERFCDNGHPQHTAPPKSKNISLFDANGETGLAKCYGINEELHRGYCVTRYTFTYAKVANQSGTIGWSKIRIRGGCECAVFDRQFTQSDVLQYLSSTV